MLADLLLNDYNKLHENVTGELNRLQKIQSTLDLTMVDIQHEIEFGNPDACTMVGIFKHQKELLMERRHIKNDIFKLQRVNGAFKKSKSVINSCKGLEGRKYKPRVLKLDFENSKKLLESRKKLLTKMLR